MYILAVIPARGGSKAIPKKNIATLHGKPLLAYTAEAALKSKGISKVLLSTDNPEIASLGKSLGISVPFLRPPELAQDETGMLPVLLHALEYVESSQGQHVDAVLLLQPTSPLRTERHIDEAIELFQKKQPDSVVSVVEVPHTMNPVSVMRLEGDYLVPFLPGPQILRRQDKPKVYARNGPAILLTSRKTLKEKKSLFGDKILPYSMQEEDSLDIDTTFDLEMAEYLIRRRLGTC